MPKSYRPKGQPRSTRNEFPIRADFGKVVAHNYNGTPVLRVASFSVAILENEKTLGPGDDVEFGQPIKEPASKNPLRLFVGSGDYPCCRCRGSGGVG